MNNIPWSEKYRPNNFDNIIMDDYNKILFNKILKTNIFPNLLFYGPPGTGKTTTVINLINKFQELYDQKSKSLIIHLNASDERGIDIIRNNIYNFVNSNNLFSNGLKFVILDEVDYMTRIAQQALKCLMQEYNTNVRYCLICNYISRIDYSLQYEFIKVRFNQLPRYDIYKFISNINIHENLNLSKKLIDNIISYFDNDIRSMINYIQSNIYKKINMVDNIMLNKLFVLNINSDLYSFNKYINIIQNKCDVHKSFIMKKYLYYVIKNKTNSIGYKYISDFEYIIHNIDNYSLCINYIFHILNKQICKT